VEERVVKTVMLYITAKDMKEAGKIAMALVRARLAACANIIGPIRSTYRWKGKIERSAEVLLTAKTRASLVNKAVARVRELHSYECPCIVSFPIDKGNPDFLKWISHETL
jgi:periplasmic divalent cation tolerance protein